jgi:hypothetical protein
MRISTLAVRLSLTALLVAGVLLTTMAGWAQQNAVPASHSSANSPNIQNSRVNQQPAAGSLATQLKDWTAQVSTPQWLGYTVLQVAGDRSMCCGGGDWNGDCGTCRLEKGEHGVNIIGNNADATVMLEGPREIAVLFRAENHQITNIRIASTECTLDAGGLPFVWLTNVKPSESVAELTTFVRNEGSNYRDSDDRQGHQALSAIALHADDSAEAALESFIRPDSPDELRKQTAFWLGEARGKAGFLALQKMAKSDPSTDVRAHVTFALSVSREPGAVDEMIRIAHDDESTHVQKRSGRHHQRHRKRSRHRSEKESRLRAQPDAERRRRAETDRGRPKQSQPCRPQTSHVLARPIQRPASARLLRKSPGAVITAQQM